MVILGVPSHGTVEVVGGKTELAVAEFVGLVSLDEGIIPSDAVLKEVRLSVKNFDVFRVGKLIGCAVTLIP